VRKGEQSPKGEQAPPAQRNKRMKQWRSRGAEAEGVWVSLSPCTCLWHGPSLPFWEKTGGFCTFRKALLEAQVLGQAWCVLLGPCQGHFCPWSLQEGLDFAAVSRPAAARQGGSLRCRAPGSPELYGSSAAKGSPGKPARQKKMGVEGGGQALEGLSPSLLAGGRCTRSMGEPEKRSPGLRREGEGRLMQHGKGPHLHYHLPAQIHRAPALS